MSLAEAASARCQKAFARATLAIFAIRMAHAQPGDGPDSVFDECPAPIWGNNSAGSGSRRMALEHYLSEVSCGSPLKGSGAAHLAECGELMRGARQKHVQVARATCDHV